MKNTPNEVRKSWRQKLLSSAIVAQSEDEISILIDLMLHGNITAEEWTHFLGLCNPILVDPPAQSPLSSLVIDGLVKIASVGSLRMAELLEKCKRDSLKHIQMVLADEHPLEYQSILLKSFGISTDTLDELNWHPENIARILSGLPIAKDQSTSFPIAMLLLASDQKHVRNFISSTTISALLHGAHSSCAELADRWTQQLMDFIHAITENCNSDDAIVSNVLGILITCFDLIMARQDLRHDDLFFKLLLKSLNQTGTACKLALYLLKSVVDYTMKYESPNNRPFSSFYMLPVSDSTEEFRRTIEPIWQDFFLLFDTLETCELHLFRPMEDKLVQFITHTSVTNQIPSHPCLAEEWWACLLEKGLATDIGSVKKMLFNILFSIEDVHILARIAQQTDTLFGTIIPYMDSESLFHIPGGGGRVSPFGEALKQFWKRLYAQVPLRDRRSFLEKAVKTPIRTCVLSIYHWQSLSELEPVPGGVWKQGVLDDMAAIRSKLSRGGTSVRRFAKLCNVMVAAVMAHVDRALRFKLICEWLDTMPITPYTVKDAELPPISTWIRREWPVDLPDSTKDIATLFWLATAYPDEHVMKMLGNFITHVSQDHHTLHSLIRLVVDRLQVSTTFFIEYAPTFANGSYAKEAIEAVWSEDLSKESRMEIIETLQFLYEKPFALPTVEAAVSTRNHLYERCLQQLSRKEPTRLVQDGKQLALTLLSICPYRKDVDWNIVESAQFQRYPIEVGENAVWGLKISDFSQAKYQVLRRWLVPETDPLPLLLEAVNDLQVSTGQAAQEIIRWSRLLLDLHWKEEPSVDLIRQLLDASWQNVLDNVTDRMLHSSVHAHVELLTAPLLFKLKVLSVGKDAPVRDMIGKLLEFSKQRNAEGLTILVDHFTAFLSSHYQSSDWSSTESLDSYQDVIVSFLMYGPKRHEPHHLIDAVFAIDEADKDLQQIEYAWEWDWMAKDYLVRTYANHLLLTLDSSNSDERRIAISLLDKLLHAKDDDVTHYNTTKFRLLMRRLNAILVLVPHLTGDLIPRYMSKLLEKLGKFSLAGVRRPLEFAVILLLRNNIDSAQVRNCIWKHLEDYTTKPFMVISLHIIILHTMNSIHPMDAPGAWRTFSAKEWQEHRVVFFNEALDKAIIWSSSSNFSIRLMTHYVLLHIYETCIDAPGTLPLPITHLEPGHLKGVLQSKHLKLVSDFLVRNPDAIRFRLESFKDDFMYQGFSPCEDYTVDFVFRGHPRLTLVAEGEWISWHAFQRRLNVAPFNAKMSLVDPTRMQRYLKAGAITEEVELEKVIASDTLQKKVTPWESMLDASMLGLERNEHIQTQKSEGLIVFASMIEKLPNLGGLARTSEIFGAERIVLPNLNVLQSQQFKSGAVSAEKWVPVEECSERDMIEYLKLKKEQGYTLVALEQTSSSVNLHSYKFPQKTVLVLGAEGLGVPANVLTLMDDCVEIEQVGVTRSLNVHVSAAIAICEWRRQSTRVAS
jgi:tRNA guanosine-2'-O-methyltransferase